MCVGNTLLLYFIMHLLSHYIYISFNIIQFEDYTIIFANTTLPG